MYLNLIFNGPLLMQLTPLLLSFSSSTGFINYFSIIYLRSLQFSTISIPLPSSPHPLLSSPISCHTPSLFPFLLYKKVEREGVIKDFLCTRNGGRKKGGERGRGGRRAKRKSKQSKLDKTGCTALVI